MIYGVPMPCSHHYSLSLEKSSVPLQYNLSFTDNWSGCVLDIATIEHEVPNPSSVHIVYMKDLTMRNIRRFSRSMKKDEIKRIHGQELHDGPPVCPRTANCNFQLDLRRDRTFQKVNDKLIIWGINDIIK
jgi:hypothetical protein